MHSTSHWGWRCCAWLALWYCSLQEADAKHTEEWKEVGVLTVTCSCKVYSNMYPIEIATWQESVIKEVQSDACWWCSSIVQSTWQSSSTNWDVSREFTSQG